MTVYDSSVLIEYLDGTPSAVEYVESHAHERAIAPPLVAFEVYQGEIFKSGPADFDALEAALSWLTVVDETAELARGAAEFQHELHERGTALSARDAHIAGTAADLGEPLVVADDDFAVDGIDERIDVTLI